VQASSGTGTTRDERAASADATEALTDSLSRDLAAFTNRLLVAGARDLFAAIEKAGLTITQVKLLKELCEADEPLSLGAMSHALGLSLPAISRSVDNLVGRGQVKRKEDPRDRRSKLVTVTARGRDTYEQLTALRLAGIKSFVAGLEPAEQEALAAAVGPVVRRLEQ
jgi:DNA-binding MarR family transcriptional regulator